MRVIGGALGGRRLAAPKGSATRPTSDRVREALFSSVAPGLGGAHVLDLYAGSGALGIEALSRGASSAVFVEHAARAAAVLRRNLQSLDLDAPVIVSDAGAFAQRWVADRPFDLVFADPPYVEPLAKVIAVLHTLWDAGALRAGARIVIERDRRSSAEAELGDWLELERQRSYGDTTLLYLHVLRDAIGDDVDDAPERSVNP